MTLFPLLSFSLLRENISGTEFIELSRRNPSNIA